MHIQTRNLLLICLGAAAAMLTCATPCPAKSPAQVSARRFGAVPDDGKDDTKGLRKAAEYCRKHPGVTLTIPSGEYIISDPEARQLEEDVMSGKYGGNPEPKMFIPYFPHVKGMDFSGSTDVTVDATGARLMVDGWMEPFSIIGCTNFTLKGLTIDYVRQPHSEGKVVEIGDNWFIVEFDDERQMDKKNPASRECLWDDRYGVVHSKVYAFNKKEVLPGNRMRFKGRMDPAMLGMTLGMTHTYHFRPAVFIGTSTNTRLEDVTIHSQPGMGVLGWDSHDISIRALRVVPREGKRFSTNTDATHFAACSGLLRLEGCEFCGQGDDAINAHGYYHNIISKDGDGWYTIQLQAPTFTHAQETDVPRIGDKVEVTSIATLIPEMLTEVADVRWEPRSLQVAVKFADPLPDNFGDFYIFNADKIPDLEFRGNRVLGNFARGVLSKARNVIVEDNYFQGCTGIAVHVGAESDWKEGSFAQSAVVRRNKIVNCGQGRGMQGDACGIAVVIGAPNTDGTFVHGCITVEDNDITSDLYNSEHGITIANAREAHVHGNTVKGCKNEVFFSDVRRIYVD